MTDDQKNGPSGQVKDFIEKRHEERHPVPDRFREYMTLHLKAGDRQVPATIANFSRSGILFESSVPFEKGVRTECTLKLSLLVVRSVSFWIEVKYCYQNKNSFIIGAEIDGVGDNTWFDFFEEIYDFIVLRKDSA